MIERVYIVEVRSCTFLEATSFVQRPNFLEIRLKCRNGFLSASVDTTDIFAGYHQAWVSGRTLLWKHQVLVHP